MLRAGGASCWWCWYTCEAWLPSSPLVDIIIVVHRMKVGATAAPCQPPLPLTAHSSTPHSLAAQPLPDRNLRAPCGRITSGASFVSMLDALNLVCLNCSRKVSTSSRPPLSRCCPRCSRRALQAVVPVCDHVQYNTLEDIFLVKL